MQGPKTHEQFTRNLERKLSNRDKAQHSKERGLDSKRVQTDQLRDMTANRGREK